MLAIFIIAFFLLLLEIAIESLMFNAIDVSKIVSCCGTIYSSSATSYISLIFKVKTSILLGVFYVTYLLMTVFYFLKNRYIFAILNISFIFISIISIIAFFGTYIYELPTHHCPFCLLQKDYYYVGYIIYILLFLGTFYGIVNTFLENRYKQSLIFNTLFVILVTSYPILFYIKNHTWL